MLRKKLASAGISRITIERTAKTARVTIHTARPGVVIGKRCEDTEKTRKEVTELMGVTAHTNAKKVRKPETDAQNVDDSSAPHIAHHLMIHRAIRRHCGKRL